MFKKITVLGLVIIAAYIGLPFGFSLWSQSLGIQGQIIFAELENVVEKTTDLEPPAEVTDGISDETADLNSENDAENPAEEYEPEEASDSGVPNSDDTVSQTDRIPESEQVAVPLPIPTENADGNNNAESNENSGPDTDNPTFPEEETINKNPEDSEAAITDDVNEPPLPASDGAGADILPDPANAQGE